MAISNGKNDERRTLNDAEARAALTLLWADVQLRRMTIAEWVVTKKRPTQDDLLRVANNLRVAESWIDDLASGPDTDGRSLDGRIDRINQQIAEIAARAKAGEEAR
jgi:hypothetical protein